MIKYFVVLLGMVWFLFPGAAHAVEVGFTASDGYPLSADLQLPGRGTDLKTGVILLPMYRHTQESWQPLVQQLTRAGFTCLSLDLRGQGKSRYGADGSDGEKKVLDRDVTFFNTMYLDVAAADNRLRKERPQLEKMVLVGASVGCSVAVHAISSGAVKAEAAVLMTPGKDYLGIPTMEHIKTWPATTSLLILSSREEQGRGAAAIYEKLRNRGAEIKLFPQTDIHGTNMFGKVPGVEGFIVDWLVSRGAGKKE